MFPAFESIRVFTREYCDDCGPPRFPWCMAGVRGYGYDYVYAVVPFWPFVWLADKLFWWKIRLKVGVARRWFKSRVSHVERDGLTVGLTYKPRWYPDNEIFAEGQLIRWRDIAVFLGRRLLRIVRTKYRIAGSPLKHKLFEWRNGCDWQDSGYLIGTDLTWRLAWRKAPRKAI